MPIPIPPGAELLGLALCTPWAVEAPGVAFPFKSGCIIAVMTHGPQNRRIEVELPEEAFGSHPWDPVDLADELRLLFLVEQVRERRLGYGKAAELAGLPIARFVRMMGKHGVSPFDYDPGELEEESKGRS